MHCSSVRLAAGIVTLATLFAGDRVRVAAQATSKLATVLDALSQSVPQQAGRVAPERAAPTRLSIDALPTAVQDAIGGRRLRLNADNEVQVYILLHAVTDETLAELKAAGVTVEIADASRRRAQARLPVSRLQAVADLPIVEFIRLPTYAVRRSGLIASEGDAIVHADAVRSEWSLDGTGVRVGVISDGLKGIFATDCTSCDGVAGGPISSGDLPPATGVRDSRGVLTSASGGVVGRSFQANGDLEGLPRPVPACSFPGAGAEGTALLEIVHDVAPGATLSFANADTDLAFAQAVNYLAATTDVVVDDLGFFGEPYDGTSAVSTNTARALNDPTNRIRIYVTSVGNAAVEHYDGPYVGSPVEGSSISGVVKSGHLHLFQASDETTDVLGLGPQPYNLIQLPQSGEVVIFLTWDDPFGAATNDYDLYLVQPSTGRVVARSIDAQRGSQDPVEAIDFVNRGPADAFRIVVQNVNDAARSSHLNLFSFEPECAQDGPRPIARGRHERHNYNTASRSVPAQSDAGGSPVAVVSVGAICSASAPAADRFSASAAPDESCNDTTHATAEFFTSRGPTLDGRLKPDIAAIDGVSITGAGSFGTLFFGTSAAAPHVAGVAALLLQAAPCLADGSRDPTDARTTLRDLLMGTADTLGRSAPDYELGAGLVDAHAAAQQTLPVFRGRSAITVAATSAAGATLSAAQLGFVDPNQCAVTRLYWTGGCGTGPGDALTCPIGTNHIAIAASNNGVAFSQAVDVTISVTPH
jgi:hypothetical protein